MSSNDNEWPALWDHTDLMREVAGATAPASSSSPSRATSSSTAPSLSAPASVSSSSSSSSASSSWQSSSSSSVASAASPMRFPDHQHHREPSSPTHWQQDDSVHPRLSSSSSSTSSMPAIAMPVSPTSSVSSAATLPWQTPSSHGSFANQQPMYHSGSPVVSVASPQYGPHSRPRNERFSPLGRTDTVASPTSASSSSTCGVVHHSRVGIRAPIQQYPHYDLVSAECLFSPRPGPDCSTKTGQCKRQTFQCTFCGMYAHAHKSKMNTHMCSHGRGTRLPCGLCDQSFTSRSNRNTHRRNKHSRRKNMH